MRRTKKQRHIEEVFISMAGYWGKIFGIKNLVIVVNYDLEDFDAVAHLHKNISYIEFTPRDLVTYKEFELVALICHEFGHIKRNAFYENVGQVEAEYQAETQALRWLKKYFPKLYKQHIKSMHLKLRRTPYTGKMIYYQKAFERIKDYR